MNKYYILCNGLIMSSGFDTQAEAETYAKNGGFSKCIIVHFVSFIE